MRNRPVKEYERAAIRIIYKDGDIVDTDTSHGAEQIIREDFPTAHISPWIRGKITVQDEGKTIAHFYPLKADGTIAKYSSSLEATQRLRNPVGPRRLPASRPSRNARFGRIPERKISIPNDEFIRQYLVTALWSSTGPDDDPLDQNYSLLDLSNDTIKKAIEDCRSFMEKAGDMIDSDISRAGHDFWLTRNGHGAGFWDGDWPEPTDRKLTDLAHSFGSVDLYVGDDGKIYST